MEKGDRSGEIMELYQIIGAILLSVSMFCLGYAIAYMQILKKLLQMLEEETKE
jgi:hypothetical protein